MPTFIESEHVYTKHADYAYDIHANIDLSKQSLLGKKKKKERGGRRKAGGRRLCQSRGSGTVVCAESDSRSLGLRT